MAALGSNSADAAANGKRVCFARVPRGVHPARGGNSALPRPALGWLARGACVVALTCACGSSNDHGGLAPASNDLPAADLTHYDAAKADARDVFSSGTCVEGTTKTCRIYLTPHEGIQPCFVGKQTCVQAAWSTCDDAVLVDANQNDQAIGSGGSGATSQP